MRPTALLAVLLACSASAQELIGKPLNRFSSGEVMEATMAEKQATWDRYEAMGYFSPGRWKSSNKFSACTNGHAKVANITYQCNNLDVTGHLSHDDLGSLYVDPKRIGSSIWGVTVDGREYVAIGQSDGAAFAQIVGKGWWNYVPYFGKKEGTLDYLGRVNVPEGSVPAIWKEIKSFKHYAIIGSEAVGHGIQLFDLRQLHALRKNPLSTQNKVFPATSHFTDLPLGRSHNVLSSPSSDTILAVGAQPRTDECLGGLIFIDASDPLNLKRKGKCANLDGYVHDAQCLIYHGPDDKYEGKEICYAYDENSLAIFDITDKSNASIISNTTYPGASYTHQGWVLDENNQEFLLMDDEKDEQLLSDNSPDGRATTLIWNITSLENPIHSGEFKSEVVSIDHNQYIAKGFSYQSNYMAGLRILDVSSVPVDPTGKGVKEVAFFDVFPEDDEAPRTEFMGTWANTGGWFKSGHIAVNTYDRGVFVVKRKAKLSGNFRAEF
jgi:choice-of-anchor B domain-containing protein